MKIPSIVSMLLVVLLSSGCGRVKTTYFVDSAESAQWTGLKGLDRVYASPKAQTLTSQDCLVRLLDPRETLIDRDRDDPKVDWTDLAPRLEAGIADVLYQSRVFRDVGAISDPGPMPEPDVELTVALIEWKRGNGLLRYFLGIGFGATRLQWEAKMRDTATGETVFAFADARLHPGGPSSFPLGFKALSGSKLLEEDFGYALIDLQNALRALNDVREKPRNKLVTHPAFHVRK